MKRKRRTFVFYKMIIPLLGLLAACFALVGTNELALANYPLPKAPHYYYNTYWGMYNYDFHPNSTGCTGGCYPDPTNYGGSGGSSDYPYVDNPVTMVFTNNASSTKVKNMLTSGGFTSLGGPEEGYFTGTNAQNSDTYNVLFRNEQKGLKTSPGCNNIPDYHVRWYGWYTGFNSGYQDALFDPYWGFFEFATTHEDINDVSQCGTAAVYGYQEEAARHVWQQFANNATYIDLSQSALTWTWFDNELDQSTGSWGLPCGSGGAGITGYISGTHCMESDGYVTKMYMK
jgi:hypothetical protein